jgi:hypothetical protein
MVSIKGFSFLIWAFLASPCAMAEYGSNAQFCLNINNVAQASVAGPGTASVISASSLNAKTAFAPNHVPGGANPTMNLSINGATGGKVVSTGSGTGAYTGQVNGTVIGNQHKSMAGIGSTVQQGKVSLNLGAVGSGKVAYGEVAGVAQVQGVSHLSITQPGIEDVKQVSLTSLGSGAAGSGSASFIGGVYK